MVGITEIHISLRGVIDPSCTVSDIAVTVFNPEKTVFSPGTAPGILNDPGTISGTVIIVISDDDNPVIYTGGITMAVTTSIVIRKVIKCIHRNGYRTIHQGVFYGID